MVPDGAWVFVYRGEAGIGLGFFEIKAGRARGSDWGGIKYSGDVTEIAGTDKLQFDLTMEVPPNVGHSSGASAMEVPNTRRRVVDLPRDFDNGEPQTFGMTPGPITVMFFRVADERAVNITPFLNGFRIVPTT